MEQNYSMKNPLAGTEVTLEACVESLKEALHAEQNGATQIELCARLDLDGMTPSESLVQVVKEQCNMEIKVMIRPRPGNFVYAAEELEEMKTAIHWCKENGINEIVIGLLDVNGDLDLANLMVLAKEAAPMHITFHKAIDSANDPLQVIAQLKNISNVKYVLSSGAEATAEAGVDFLRKMKKACEPEIQLIAAGKVRYDNIAELHAELNLNYYHGRKIV